MVQTGTLTLLMFTFYATKLGGEVGSPLFYFIFKQINVYTLLSTLQNLELEDNTFTFSTLGVGPDILLKTLIISEYRIIQQL